MAGSVANTKTYFVGPQDGWYEIMDSTGANALFFLRISAVPHEQQFRVYAGTTAPTVTTAGVLVSRKPFEVSNFSAAGTATKYYVAVTNPVASSTNGDGRLRIDVYADGGTLQ